MPEEIVSLTPEERLKFSLWCRQESSSTEAIIKEMKNLPTTATLALLASRKVVEARAFAKVAEILENLVSVTIENR